MPIPKIKDPYIYMSEMYDDLKEALDHLFDIVKELEREDLTGFPRTKKQRLEKLNIAIKLYNKHFVC